MRVTGGILFFAIAGVLVFSLGFRHIGKDEDKEVEPRKKELLKPFPIPETIFFAGEEMPLWNYDVRERFDRELMVNSFFHSQTLKYLKKSKRYFEIIDPILKADTIPLDFKYLALAESGLDERAVSDAGAVGLWQFLAGTAREYGLEVNKEVDERYHIEKATKAACRYLKDSYEIYGNWTMVAASYNAGRRGVDQQIERQKEHNYYDLLLNDETARYVYRITSLKTIMENPEQYGLHVNDDDYYPTINYRKIEINSGVEDFADFAKNQGINYKILKDFNPWLRQAYLTNKSGKKYTLKIADSPHRRFD